VTKERRLGRGLEALLGRPLEETEGRFNELHLAHPPTENPDDNIHPVSVYHIDGNPYQPRRDFDESEIDELSASLKEHGLLQPIVVRRQGERFQLIAGERRLRAAIKAGWHEIVAQIREADDRQMAELAIVENLNRKDLNALEKAAAFQQYLEQYRTTQEELAGRLKIDRSTIANLIRLLELPEAVQESLRLGRITQGHARALLPLGDDREQIAFCQKIEAESLSVRSVEALVQEAIRAADSEPLALVPGSPASVPAGKTGAKRSQHLAALEHELRRALGTKVDVRLGAKQRGKIVIFFNSHDEFDRLREQLVAGEPPALRSQVG
jgi:ParB family transcriptional regulator, chromosome partitioning protein